MVRRLVASGVDVFRINFSHGDRAEHLEEMLTIRNEASRAGRTVAILQDLPGPKIRVGRLENGAVELVKGSTILLTTREVLGNENEVSVNYPDLIRSVGKGNALHLADGLIRLRVEESTPDGARCTVVAGGTLSSGKGVNAPGVRMKITYPTPQDVEHLKFGLSHGVDFVALSFVRSPSDVKATRKLFGKSEASVIVKVEKREAVENFDLILQEADGIMVARGDLGIEMPIERVPVIQKEIISKCNEAGKPVIVATQMLVSMVTNPLPSRAEATDVSTAVLDGADAVMLSDETAVGKYPVEAVLTLERIARSAERVLGKYGYPHAEETTLPTEEAIARAASRLARYVGAKVIVTPTHTGSTARRVSKYRPEQPIVALCTSASVARRLKICWGVVPVLARETRTTDRLFAQAESTVLSLGLARPGDSMVMSSGTPGVGGSTDLIKVMRITGQKGRGGS
jgi:pyruvate kinase